MAMTHQHGVVKEKFADLLANAMLKRTPNV